MQSGAVSNQRLALKRYFRQFRGQQVEACGFWPAFREVVEPEMRRLVLVHRQRVKAIASAKLKNNRVDSANQVQAVLQQQGQRSPVTDVFGKRGRQWRQQVKLPEKARQAVAGCLRMIDSYTQEIEEQNRQLSGEALKDARARWLMTIPGIGVYSAVLLLAEIGNIERFPDKEALCSYAGLVPRVRESAGRAARVALARKLLSAVYAILRDGLVFEESEFAAV